jgi:hypothetical protein
MACEKFGITNCHPLTIKELQDLLNELERIFKGDST